MADPTDVSGQLGGTGGFGADPFGGGEPVVALRVGAAPVVAVHRGSILVWAS